MTVNVRLFHRGLAAFALAACAGRSDPDEAPLARSAAGEPVAVVADGSAEFGFPVGWPGRFLATREDSVQGYPDQGFIWSVTWDVGGRLGSVPGSIQVRGGVPAVVPPGEDTLSALLAHARAAHTVFCIPCTTPAQRLIPEPALSAAVRGGRVVLTVRGREALQRLWPAGAPDSVALTWRGPGPVRESRKVPLVRVRK